MDLPKLLVIISIIAIILTLFIGLVWKKKNSWLMTFLQNFVGVFFVISGAVKAVDPLGTAYKMKDYFGEFQSTFEGSFLSPFAGMFPFLTNYIIGLAVGMIVFEIVLGIMLILGHRPKLTAWLFLALMLLFTVMTGFTYLTGYVPEGVNFFEFSKWSAYLKSNMKVTDCGCFGDFIKLEPFTTFTKDVILLFPGLYFLLKSKLQHQLYDQKTRDIITIISIVGLSIYCFSNYMWDIPKVDFRPFKKDVNILAQKELEENAMASVAILSWHLKNKNSGEQIELSNADYMKNYKNYPKKDWEIIDQTKTKPAIKSTKISEFELDDPEGGGDVSYDMLSIEDANFMVVCHKLKAKSVFKQKLVKDSIFIDQAIKTLDDRDSTIKVFDKIVESSVDYVDYIWDENYIDHFTSKIKPLVEAAKKDGKRVYIAAGADSDMIKSLLSNTGIDVEYYTADDILLKTIVRSNPGVLLMKNSKILNKWHYNKLPTYEEIKQSHKF